jgi:hypothetical protein
MRNCLLQPVAVDILDHLVGVIVFQRHIRRGRQRRSFCAWAALAVVLRWRSVRALVGSFDAWRARVAVGHANVRRANERNREAIAARAFRIWKAAYAKVRSLHLSSSSS